MNDEIYECAICGYKSWNRAEFVEFIDSVKLPKVVELAKLKGAKLKGRDITAENIRYLCLKCNVELYQEETKPPKAMKVVCPKCGEVIDVWF
jgi:DNA-directed RNA polymerase subunit RPC12/RpoP